jgi:hypothetical protein
VHLTKVRSTWLRWRDELKLLRRNIFFVLKRSSVHINHGRGSCLMLSKDLGWNRNQNAGTITTRLLPRMVPVYLVTPLTSLGNVPYIGLLTPTLVSLGSHYHSPIPGAGWINPPDKKAHLSRIHWHTTKNSAHSIIITKTSLTHSLHLMSHDSGVLEERLLPTSSYGTKLFSTPNNKNVCTVAEQISSIGHWRPSSLNFMHIL